MKGGDNVTLSPRLESKDIPAEKGNGQGESRCKSYWQRAKGIFGGQYALPLTFSHRGEESFKTSPWQVVSIISYIGFLIYVIQQIPTFNTVISVEIEEVFKDYIGVF